MEPEPELELELELEQMASGWSRVGDAKHRAGSSQICHPKS